MEQVFWLMWASDVIGQVKFIAWIFVVVFAILWAIYSLCVCADDIEPPEATKLFKYSKWLLLPVFVCAFTPSQMTIQIMAATKATESAADTQIGKKGLEAVSAVLDRIIGEAKKTAKKD